MNARPYRRSRPWGATNVGGLPLVDPPDVPPVEPSDAPPVEGLTQAKTLFPVVVTVQPFGQTHLPSFTVPPLHVMLDMQA